jgi:hypothetical protein
MKIECAALSIFMPREKKRDSPCQSRPIPSPPSHQWEGGTANEDRDARARVTPARPLHIPVKMRQRGPVQLEFDIAGAGDRLAIRPGKIRKTPALAID